MAAYEKPLRVFVAAAAQKSFETIESLLASEGGADISRAASAGEARRMLMSESYDIAIVNAPLPDENGLSLSVFICAEKQTETILLVRAEYYDEISDKVLDFGVLTVSKPISRSVFHQTFRLALAGSRRSASLKDENRRLLTKIDEIKLIERAKWALIEHEALSESEAHRRIEKLSMDLRLSRGEIAREILKKHNAKI